MKYNVYASEAQEDQPWEVERPWQKSVLPAKGEALWGHKDGLCLCIPLPITSLSQALFRPLRYRNASTMALLSSKGASREGEGPAISQV